MALLLVLALLWLAAACSPPVTPAPQTIPLVTAEATVVAQAVSAALPDERPTSTLRPPTDTPPSPTPPPPTLSHLHTPTSP
ncbi:MAG: hypothetical protein SXV54_27185, partial [Chloroflexota bacterium]|nr:hypothetical protein [Chloroflexota bacterium]